MKKRTVGMFLALAMLLTLGVPALAAEESPVRLAKVEIYSEGLLYQQIDLDYYDGTQLMEQDARTYYYDGSEQSSQSYRIVTTYNTDGQAEKDEGTYMEGGQVIGTDLMTYIYDEDGMLIEDVDEYTEGDSSSVIVNNYEYEFDDQGRIAVITQYTDGEAVQTREYTYDGEGNIASINNRMVSYGWAVLNEYTYDGEGRFIANRLTYDNGAPGAYWEYSYEPDAYFQLRYSVQYVESEPGAGYKPSGSSFYAEIPEGEGRPGLSFILRSTPQLIYDEAGYLILADAGEGNYISFTYEPAA